MKYSFLIHNRAAFRTATGTPGSYVMGTVSWKNGCQNFSYVHSSRKHWKCKYCNMYLTLWSFTCRGFWWGLCRHCLSIHSASYQLLKIQSVKTEHYNNKLHIKVLCKISKEYSFFSLVKTKRQHSEECMCRLQNISMLDRLPRKCDNQQTDRQIDRWRTKWFLCAAFAIII